MKFKLSVLYYIVIKNGKGEADIKPDLTCEEGRLVGPVVGRGVGDASEKIIVFEVNEIV